MATLSAALLVSRTSAAQGRHALIACYLGWTLDAFDFCIMVFVMGDVAKAFGVPLGSAALAMTLTLMCRTFGALIFGRIADRFGRRITLMINILCFSVLELASGLAPTLTAFLILRALFGIAMGGEWGIGGALVMETVPPHRRGLASGILQSGYSTGYLLASLLYLAFPLLGWRGMFIVGAVPALLVLYIRRSVAESPAWQALPEEARKVNMFTILRTNLHLSLFAILLMTAFNFFAHGAQDLYPSAVLRGQRGLSTDMISLVMVAANVGAIVGGILFGWLSELMGRKWALILAALLCLPVLPFWFAATTPFMLGLTHCMLLFFIQGAWGIVPVYLIEMSPPEVRGTFPGFAYQTGNFIAAANANIQIWMASGLDGNYALVLASTAAVMAGLIAVMAIIGPETKGARIGAESL